jgi:hypothetical protein
MWRRWLLVLLVAALIIVVIISVEIFSLASESNPQRPSNAHNQYQPVYASLVELFLGGWRWVRDRIDHDTLTTIAIAATAFFTGTLWRATTRLWETSQIQANHMSRSVEIMEAAERRQVRAYVGVSDIRFDFLHISDINWKAPDPLPASGYIYEDKILVTVKNFGETPAYELRIVVNWRLLAPFGVHPPTDYSFPEYAPVVPVTASEVLDKGHIFTGTINVGDMRDFQAAEAKVANLYVYGRILYTDVYGRRWRREYCYVYEPWRRESERFTPHTGRNDETYVGPRPPKLPA